MSVFDGKVKIGRQVADPGTDPSLPTAGSLNYGAIKAVSAMAGTNGVDALLMNGNRDRQINGNESTRITENRSHTVGGNQQKTVSGNRTDMIAGNHLTTTIGNLHRSVVGTTNDLFTGSHAVEHKAPQLLQEPTEFMHMVKNRLSQSESKWDTYAHYLVTAKTQTAFTGHFTDIRLSSFAGTGIATALTPINLHVEGIDNAAKALDNKLAALDSKIGAIQPAIYVTMLHEVAITQKILIIGVNQYI
jgi:hypothetical protein